MNYRIFLTILFILITIVIPTPQSQVMAAIGGINLTQTTTKTKTPAKTVDTKSTVTPPAKVVNVKPAVTPQIKTTTYFVPMTNFPAFKNSTNGDLGAFINMLYKYFIGIAAVLAVLEITWGGFLWMGSGASITNKEAGKKKINMALMGLLLVLSPVIIFSIINPSVLSLKLGNSIKINKIVPASNTGLSQNTPATGCTLVGSKNSYFEKFICSKNVSSSDALKYCPDSFPTKTVSCNQKTLINGVSECVSNELYCSGKNISVRVYQTKALTNYTVFQDDIPLNNAFTNSCNSNGGIIKSTSPKAKIFYRFTGDSCKGYPNVPLTNGVYGAICYDEVLTCTVP